MTITVRSSAQKMSRARGQSSGWAAFDMKQRRKNNLESEVDKEPFPPIGNSSSVQHGDNLGKKNNVPLKAFSSVLLPAKNFPPLKEARNNQMVMLSSGSVEKYCGTNALVDANSAINKLKEKHLWAENRLIEDILAAVDNDVDEAASILEKMAPAANFEESKVSSDHKPPTSDNIQREKKTDENLTFAKVKDDTPLHSNLGRDLKGINKDMEHSIASSGQKLYDDDNLRYTMGLFNIVPVEPEWEEEDDIYVIHRKDALKMMRSANRHSRAAANAFLRGDHGSAQQLSMKARKEWHNAEELNSEAATKILRIRNSENDIWRLDLHGLHATEAIQALQEHLTRIESQGLSKISATSTGVKENGFAHSTHGSVTSMNEEELKKQAPIRLRSAVLEVITGIGNHSRGQASLPTSVRSFLSDNRYRYEELRPGVITVWPKFRQG